MQEKVVYSVIVPILAVNLFFNVIVLVILGIIGEYIGRIYDEAKGRPLYVVSRVKNIKK